MDKIYYFDLLSYGLSFDNPEKCTSYNKFNFQLLSFFANVSDGSAYHLSP